jgi:hypothetical protein
VVNGTPHFQPEATLVQACLDCIWMVQKTTRHVLEKGDFTADTALESENRNQINLTEISNTTPCMGLTLHTPQQVVVYILVGCKLDVNNFDS